MQKPDPVNAYFERYPITHPAYMVARISGRLIRDRAGKYFSGRLIEIGCGDKSKGLLVGDFVTEHIGLDHEGSPHDTSNVDIFGSAYDIPQDDESFDSVLSTAVLEHLEDPQAALREACRVLKSSGFAIYTAPLFWHLHEEPRDFFRYTRYGLDYLFRAAGFKVIEIIPMSGFWITFGTEFSYYLEQFPIVPIAKILKSMILLVNMLLSLLERYYWRFQPGSDTWTWMYMVVARKP